MPVGGPERERSDHRCPGLAGTAPGVGVMPLGTLACSASLFRCVVFCVVFVLSDIPLLATLPLAVVLRQRLYGGGRAGTDKR